MLSHSNLMQTLTPFPADTPWLTTIEAAKYLKLSPRTLDDYRTNSVGPAYTRRSHNVVRYYRPDLDAWMREATL